MSASYTAHTVRKWRKAGYYCEVTEKTIRLPNGQVRKSDLHGFADVVAINDEEIVYLQTTSVSNMSGRYRKIVSEGTVGRGKYTEKIRHIAARLLGFDHVRIVVEGWVFDEDAWRWRDKEREITIDDVTWEREGTK